MTELIHELLTPFRYDYMVKAIWVSGLIGAVCGVLSSFVTLKGWSLMGDALSHAVVPGVAIAYILGLPFSIGAFISALLAAAAMAFVKAKTRIREDAVIGIVFTSFFALGLLLISLFPARVDLKSIIFGNILGISNHDIIQVIVMSVITLTVLGLKWKDLMLFCFDRNQSQTIGLSPRLLHLTLLTLLSATAVAALQAVGATLVMAMLVTPGATAYLLCDSFKKMLWMSAAMGLITSLVGAYASFFFDGATGACIVTLQTCLFLVVFIFAPKHGFLVSKRNVKRQVKENAVPSA